MALSKKITSSKGVVSEYHKIVSVSINSAVGEVSVHVASFSSKAYREKSVYNDVDTLCLFISCTIEDLEKTPIYKLLYDKLKETELFKGAEDV
jgi:hypothetical protein